MIAHKPQQNKWTSGQSLIELALALPVVLLLLAGMLEVGFLFYAYMTAIDQTREAARFASTRRYDELVPGTIDPANPLSACKDKFLHYYYDTACFFTDTSINPTLPISRTRFEDVTISVFTIQEGVIVNRYPENTYGVWSLYDDNWRKDCHGNVILDEPFFTNSEIVAMLDSNAPGDRGLVLVEVFFCYEQKMGFFDFKSMERLIPNPMRLHAYTIMPAPEALPEP